MLGSADWKALQDEPQTLLDDSQPAVRRLAIARCGDVLARDENSPVQHALERLLVESPDARDRTAAAEALGRSGATSIDALLSATKDEHPSVLEAVANACGEIESPDAVPWLMEAAETHSDNLVREAAVAALGAIGDHAAVEVLLRLVTDGPPQVRRRSVVALTVFDDPRIEPALRAAAADRNPMVREVAEMVVGHASEWTRLDPPT